MKKHIPLTILAGLILGTICLATAPTTIQPTDLLVNSRNTINTNFANLYTGQPTLIDCSGTAGRFVVTLNGGGTSSVCATLTWANILALSGTPATFVTNWNSRSGSVSLTSADVAAVEQDLRNTASPNFVGLGLGGNLAVTGTSAFTGTSVFTGAATFNGGIGTINSGTWQGSLIGPTYGGTGVNNGAYTLTLASAVTGPSSTGTLVGSGDTGTVTNTMLAGSIAASKISGTACVLNSCALTSNASTTQEFRAAIAISGGYNAYSGTATCTGGLAGYTTTISDSTVNTWGTAITVGGGMDAVLAFCNGSTWTVAGK